jgi:hypothetical protein
MAVAAPVNGSAVARSDCAASRATARRSDARRRSPPPQPAARHVQRDDADPRSEHFDVVAALEPFPRAGAGLVDRVARRVGVAGDEPHGSHQPAVVEHIEVVEPTVVHRGPEACTPQ